MYIIMSNYYILPKINSNVSIKPVCSSEQPTPIISLSLCNYYYDIHKLIFHISSNESEIPYTELIKYIIPNQLLTEKIPGQDISVSKILNRTIIFFDLVELYNTIQIFDTKNPINTLSIGIHANDSEESMKFKRKYTSETDTHACISEINNINYRTIRETKFNIIFYELLDFSSLNVYTTNLINVLMVIINNQRANGSCIIKVDCLYHRPVLEILYILSSMYKRVYITKPTTSNIISNDRYIVCNEFDEESREINKTNYSILFHFLRKYPKNQNITRLLQFELPCNFLNKVDDINLIYGQQQLEYMNTIITILKHKNKFDRLQQTLANNIQKTILCCVRNNIPYNRELSEKTNLFL
jgi:hypothetical protein